MTTSDLPLVAFDERGRVGLKKYIDSTYCLVKQHSNGAVTLIPATVTPTDLDHALRDDPTMLERIAAQGPPPKKLTKSSTWEKIKKETNDD